MLSKPTVLILGAGSSTHLGYPLGTKLIDQLSGFLRANSLGELPREFSESDAHGLVTKISRSGDYSIDAFLGRHPEYAPLGKYLLAKCIKAHEQLYKLFPPHESGWYRYLLNTLVDDASKTIGETRLSVITYNYDRSLEAYLHEAIKSRFDIDDAAALVELEKIPIVHVHGSLGAYPDYPYCVECTAEELLDISKSIKIIHEVGKADRGFCSPDFERANALLQKTDRVIFLGFGFHEDNVKRLKFFDKYTSAKIDIYAACGTIGKIAQEEMIKRLQVYGIGRATLNGNLCNNFFDQVVAL